MRFGRDDGGLGLCEGAEPCHAAARRHFDDKPQGLAERNLRAGCRGPVNGKTAGRKGSLILFPAGGLFCFFAPAPILGDFFPPFSKASK